MAEGRIKLRGEDAASAVVDLVGRSLGELTAETLKASKAVSDLKKELQEAVNKGQQGSIAAITAQLDEAIPKLQETERELRDKLKPALNDNSNAATNFGSALGGLRTALGAVGVSLTAAGLIAFGTSLVQNIAHIQDLHESTGVSTTALQKFAYVGSGAGLSMDDMGRAVSTLSDRLAGGDKSVVEAVQRFGLSVDGLLKAGPEETFIAMGEAVGRIANPMEKNTVAADLFGSALSKKLIPALGDLRQAMDNVPKEALVADQDIRAIDELTDGITHMRMEWEGWLASRALGILKPSADDWKKMIGFDPNATDTQLPATPVQPAPLPPGFVDGYRQGADAVDKLHEAFKEFSDRAAENAAEKAAAAAKRLAEQLVEYQAKVAAANERISAAFEGYRHIVDGMDQATVTQVRNAYEHGAAMSDLALSFKLTGVEAAALAEQFKFEALMAKAAAGIHAELATSVWETSRAMERLASIPNRIRVPKLESGPNAQLEALAKPFSENLSEALRKDLPASIMRAVEGGGSIIGAAGSTMGGFLVSEKGFGKQLSGGLTSLFGKGLGDAISSMLPGLGALMGPLLEKMGELLKDAFGGPSKQELEGRDAEAAFEARFKDFDDMVNRIGDAYAATGRNRADAQAAVQEMLDAERFGAEAVADAMERLQGVLDEANRIRQRESKYGMSQSELVRDAEEAKATYEDMERKARESGEYTQDQLNRAYYDWQVAMAAAGDAAAKAWVAAHDAAEGATSSASKAMSELQRQRDEIAGTYANEAVEAEMGSVERDARARVAALEAQMAAQQAAVDENTKQATDAAQTIEDEFGGCWGRTRDGGISAAQEISDYFEGLDIHVPITFDYEEPEFGGTGRAKSYANEGYDLTRPHLARIGDATGDSESVLRAQTVRDIVRASRNAGATQVLEGGRSGGVSLAGLQATVQQLVDVVRAGVGATPPVVRITIPIDGRVLGETVVNLAKDDKYGIGTGFRSLGMVPV